MMFSTYSHTRYVYIIYIYIKKGILFFYTIKKTWLSHSLLKNSSLLNLNNLKTQTKCNIKFLYSFNSDWKVPTLIIRMISYYNLKNMFPPLLNIVQEFICPVPWLKLLSSGSCFFHQYFLMFKSNALLLAATSSLCKSILFKKKLFIILKVMHMIIFFLIIGNTIIKLLLLI